MSKDTTKYLSLDTLARQVQGAKFVRSGHHDAAEDAALAAKIWIALS